MRLNLVTIACCASLLWAATATTAPTSTTASIADQHPLWQYDWSKVVDQQQWLFLLNPRPWTWTAFTCEEDCCNAVCEDRTPAAFEDCVARVPQICQVRATARVSILEEDYRCLLHNPSFGDYGYDGTYSGYQLEWDVSWLPLGSDPTWLEWQGVPNDCLQGSMYLRNAQAETGACKLEITMGDREQTVTNDSLRIYYDGQMSNSHGATRAMLMIACHHIEVDWALAAPFYEFEITSLGLKDIITPLVRPSTTTAEPGATGDTVSAATEGSGEPETETETSYVSLAGVEPQDEGVLAGRLGCGVVSLIVFIQFYF
eukprot:Gregarina_sp_Pseudo_9__1654@NODE_2111_length_1145_cov_60_559675_g1947_i0_p1_GENE_NODE_2111_length_1145_cov_60_559675_g1947_i0NODE_2111_length_1145_cov_60_559675_g1947_i0_p1_ORF_typecomplete_len325_score61_79_NODE_2111_length_1145_cov_60_559675_g1947_i01711115